MGGPGELSRQRDEVLRVCERPGSAEQLFADLTQRLRKVVPFGGSALFGLDPATNLATAPAWIENVHESHCSAFWPREFLVEDANLFLSMTRSQTAAAGLVAATHGRPARSARYREFLAPQGYGDELRAVLRADRSSWGSISLYRDGDEPPFSPQEIEFVASLTRPLAEALRARMVAEAAPAPGDPAGPGVLVLDRSASLVNVNADGHAWLDQLPGAVAAGQVIPLPVSVLLAHAVAVADGHERGPARMRVRSARGRWLLLHASHLGGAAGSDLFAVVVEPAPSAEIAPIIVEAYALTPREQETISALARGLGTSEIAKDLHLSAHTVRDHVKSVFGKLGVSSRGELVAKLFAQHYEPQLHEVIDHKDATG